MSSLEMIAWQDWPFQVPRLTLRTAVLSGDSVPKVAVTVPARCVTNSWRTAPFNVTVPENVSVTATGASSVGPVGSSLSQADADRPMARTKAKAESGRNIGMFILLDNDGTTGLAGPSTTYNKTRPTKGLIGMRVFALALALSLTLMAAPSFAQAKPPAPAAPRPAGQAAPQQPAPPPAAAQPAPPPRAPFQAGLKYAYVNVQEIAATSNEGKGFNAKVQALQEQRIKELQDKQKALVATQQKLEQGGSVLNDT